MAPEPAARSSGEIRAYGQEQAASGAESARRVLSILQAFTPHQHTRTARELAAATSIPLPSMYRYLALLRETGLLTADNRGAYSLSVRLVSLARAAEAAESLIGMADPVMRDLVRECGEAAFFVRLIAQVPVCVHRVNTAYHPYTMCEPGQQVPLYRGATGRVLFAGLSEQARHEHLVLLAQTDPEAAARMKEAVARAAACGWATSEDEVQSGVWAASAAVTNGGSTVAALTVPSLLSSASAELKERLLSQVRAAAAMLSERIADAERS